MQFTSDLLHKARIMPMEQWKAFKAEHGKSYRDDEDAKRFEIFEENLAIVNAHNKKYAAGEVSYSMGLNQFSDWIPFTWAEPPTATGKANIKHQAQQQQQHQHQQHQQQQQHQHIK